MTEKLKVSREVADVLDSLNRKDLNTSTWLEMHSHKKWESAEKAPLNELSLEEFATALIVGYEVEMTPHEVIAKKYMDAKRGREIALEAGENDTALFNRGVMTGIKHTLRALDTTVEGVNDHDSKD